MLLLLLLLNTHRLQKEVKQQDKQFEQLEDLLTNPARSWWGGKQLPCADMLSVLIGKQKGG